MPDAWEKSHGLDPANAADANQIPAKSDWTNLELYLDHLTTVPAGGP